MELTRRATGLPLWKNRISEITKKPGAANQTPHPTKPLTKFARKEIKAPSVLKKLIKRNTERNRNITAQISLLTGGT